MRTAKGPSPAPSPTHNVGEGSESAGEGSAGATWARAQHRRMASESSVGLAEHLFELVNEALGQRMVDGFAVDAREFLEQLALARG